MGWSYKYFFESRLCAFLNGKKQFLTPLMYLYLNSIKFKSNNVLYYIKINECYVIIVGDIH